MIMSRSTAVALGVIVLCLLVSGYFSWQAINKQSSPNTDGISNAAIALTTTTEVFTDIQGNPQSVSQKLAAKEVIIAHSWATWVPSSAADLRALANLQNSYQDKPISFLAINRSEPSSIINSYLQGVDTGDLTVLVDTADHFFSTNDGRTMPETVIINTDGETVLRATGPVDVSELKAAIGMILRANQ